MTKPPARPAHLKPPASTSRQRPEQKPHSHQECPIPAAIAPKTSAGQKRNPRTFTYADRQRLDRAAELYLCKCYRTKTVARASEFARELGLTPEYVSTRATQILGKSLRAYLREKQSIHAAWLLRTLPKEITVEEIAVRAAFGTPATFYRCFREVYGVTPGAYRELKK